MQHPMVTYAAQDTIHRHWSEVPSLANYSVKFGVRDATCFNNGQVGFVYVQKSNGAPVTQAQYTNLGLGDIRIGYQGTHSIDTTTRWYGDIVYNLQDTTWVQMESGSFNITLEFTVPSSQPNEYYIVDTTVSLTVLQKYREPVVTALMTMSHDGKSLGNIPTLECSNTGRIQVRVDGGTLPYHFVVKNHDDNTVWKDTVITSVPTTESGTINDHDSTRADYYRYYTFDNMPEGVWDFYFVDHCDYGFNGPATIQSVETVQKPYLKDVEIWASSGNVSDFNVVRINAVIAPAEYPIYMKQFADFMQYRFVNGTANNAQVPFKALLPNGLPSSYNGTSDLKVTIYDTIRTEGLRYCDFWGLRDTLELRMNGGPCGNYMTWDTFSVYNTNREYYTQGDEQITDSIIQMDACHQSIYQHKDNFFFAYKENHPDHRTAGKDHQYWRYHFTYPIVWEYKDYGTQAVYKRDTVWGEGEDNIARNSVLTSQDILAQNPGAFSNGAPVQVLYSLVDANGCELYNGSRQVDIKELVLPSASPSWEIVKNDPVCCNKRRTITIREKNGIEGANYEGTIIRMLSSPNNTVSLYGFIATYVSGVWEITKNDPINGPDVTPLSTGMGVVLSEYCLPPGRYQFEVLHAPCVNSPYRLSVDLKEIEYTDIEDGGAQHAIVSDCIQDFVTYTSGRMGKRTITSSGETMSYVPTRFRMVSGPVGGYDPLDTRTYCIPDPTHNIPGDSVRITVFTDSTHPYIFKIYPEDNSGLCDAKEVLDTVWYNGNSLTFDFAMALLCNKESTLGPVYVLAKQGTPPYTYTLYDHQDQILAGPLQAETDTLKLSDIPMDKNHQLHCKIVDACGAYYTVNFYPQILAELQKTWFDNGAKVLSTCEGTEVHLHSLQLGSIFTYKWYKVVPGGVDVPIAETSNPALFLPREADTAIYRVEIGVESCSAPLQDSLWINPMPAPYLKMSSDVTVCATEDADFWFSPVSRQKDENGKWTDVSFKVVVQNPLGKDTLEFDHIRSGDTVRHTINPLLETIIYPVSIDDGRCDYEVPDDTLFVHISNNVVSPCIIPTWHDTVCYNSDALLKASCLAPASHANPNVLSWYANFELSHFLKSDALTQSGDTSYYSIEELKERTYRYITVAKEGYCPPSNLTANGGVVTMSGEGGTTAMSCISGVLFYDDGGADGNYKANVGGGSGNNQTHLFVSEDNRQVVIHFDTLSLADGSSLSIFSGGSINADSLLIQFTGNEENAIHNIPDIIMSKGNKLLVYFKPGPIAGLGWTAYVRSAPAIAIADVIIPSKTQFSDRVCQSQTKGYYNPAMFALEIPGVNQANLSEMVKKSGSYYYTKTITSSKGCDSTVSFILTVDAAPYVDTMVVTTSVTGFTWHTKQGDSTYYKPGIHVVNTPDADGCDNLEVLKLVVIEVSNPDVESCYGDSAVVGIFVDTYDSVKTATELIDNELHTVGDIICQDASGARKILNPDSFLLYTGLTPLGVVVYMNPDNTTGIAISLTDANDTVCFPWAYKKDIGGTTTYTNSWDAIMDTSGYTNTQNILATVGMTGDPTEDLFKLKANVPATYYCYYYNPYTSKLDVTPHGCYLPSTGEMYLYFAYRTVINKSLEKLADFGAELPRSGMEVHYWTSTGGNKAEHATCINGKGQLCMHHEKSRVCYTYDGNYVTRAVRAFFKF